MKPFIELAIERWAREYNNKYDQELITWKSKRLWHTHPPRFRGATTDKKIRERSLAPQEGGTAEVLEARAAKRAKDNTVINESPVSYIELALERWSKECNTTPRDPLESP